MLGQQYVESMVWEVSEWCMRSAVCCVSGVGSMVCMVSDMQDHCQWVELVPKNPLTVSRIETANDLYTKSQTYTQGTFIDKVPLWEMPCYAGNRLYYLPLKTNKHTKWYIFTH